MSKVIDKLIRKATVEVPHERQWDATIQVFDKKLFAELLLAEGCRVMEEADSFYGEWMAKVLKQHFGIE